MRGREFMLCDEERRARLLVWTLKCVTGICDTGVPGNLIGTTDNYLSFSSVMREMTPWYREVASQVPEEYCLALRIWGNSISFGPGSRLPRPSRERGL